MSRGIFKALECAHVPRFFGYPSAPIGSFVMLTSMPQLVTQPAFWYDSW